ncbi:MAG: ABC transporter transmembrane domain-containing protein, partial [Acutalibacteraceae bacterium]
MKTSDIIKRLLKYAKNNVRFFILSVIFSLFGVSLQLATPIITGKAIDNIVSQGNVNFEKVLQIIILLAAAIILSTVFQWLTSNFTNALTYKTVSSLRKDAYKKLSQVELKYIDSQSHGDVMTKITTDIDLVSDGLLQGFTQLFSGIITIVGTLILMLRINYKIALVVIILTPISLFAASFIAKHTHDKFTE